MNETIMLNPTTQTYTFEFVMQAIYDDMQLSIQVGTETAPVTFDNVRLVKKSAGPVTISSQKDLEHGLIYPNPASDHVTIIAENGATVKIFNSMGLLTGTMTPENNQVSFNVAGLPAGLYIVEVAYEDQISVSRLLIK
jgi:hypothetical protein